MSLNPRIGTFVLIACALSQGGCATETRPDPAGDATGATEVPAIVADPGAETRLQPGQLLVIALDGNASTGYAWEIVEDGRPVLERARGPASTSLPPPPPLMVGAGSTSRWHFRAVRSGSTTVRLVYRRAWEKQVEPVRTAVYRVVVE